MIKIKNVRTLDGEVIETTLSGQDYFLDAEKKLTILPAVIDPQVYFADWIGGARAAVNGGVASVFELPIAALPCSNKEELAANKQSIEKQLAEAKIPLRYHLFLEAEKRHLEDIGKVKKQIAGVKIPLYSMAEEDLERAIQIANQENLIILVQGEDEKTIQANKIRYAAETDPAAHSKIHDSSAAVKTLRKAIQLAEKFDAQMLYAQLSTKEELDLIREAKRNELMVYCMAAIPHLFLSEKDYAVWGEKVQMAPPLRTAEDQNALWEGLRDGSIDMLCSGHSDSGIPCIQHFLPLLLNAYHEKKISLERIVAVTRINAESIFGLRSNEDVVLIDLEKEQKVSAQNTWSPFAEKMLKGWPAYTIVQGQVFHP